MTDDKLYYSLQKFTNKIVSGMLLQKIDQEPSVGVSVEEENWMNGPIEYFLKNDKKQTLKKIMSSFNLQST